MKKIIVLVISLIATAMAITYTFADKKIDSKIVDEPYTNYLTEIRTLKENELEVLHYLRNEKYKKEIILKDDTKEIVERKKKKNELLLEYQAAIDEYKKHGKSNKATYKEMDALYAVVHSLSQEIEACGFEVTYENLAKKIRFLIDDSIFEKRLILSYCKEEGHEKLIQLDELKVKAEALYSKVISQEITLEDAQTQYDVINEAFKTV